MAQKSAMFVDTGDVDELYYNAREGGTCNYAWAFGPMEVGYLDEGEITGVTRDDAGVAVGGFEVKSYQTSNDVKTAQTKSDPSGNYTVYTIDKTTQHYLRDYLSGAPDQSGVTVNTVVGS